MFLIFLLHFSLIVTGIAVFFMQTSDSCCLSQNRKLKSLQFCNYLFIIPQNYTDWLGGAVPVMPAVQHNQQFQYGGLYFQK